MIEEWKTIEGYEGMYRVSNLGRVQTCSVPGGKARAGWRDLTIGYSREGYHLVYLWDKSRPLAQRRVRRLVHQLVATYFVPATEPHKNCVNHINGVKTDNRPCNLEWCTKSENMRHAWRTGLCKAPKLTPDAVRQIRAATGTDTSIARAFGVSQPLITKIRAHKIWRNVE